MLLKNHINLLIFKMENIGKKLSTEINISHKILKICKLSLCVGDTVNILIHSE